MSRIVYPFEDEYVTDAAAKNTPITTLGGVLGLAQIEERPSAMQTMVEEMLRQSVQVAEMQVKVVEQLRRVKEDTQRLKELEAKEVLRVEKMVQRKNAAEARLKAYGDSADDWF